MTDQALRRKQRLAAALRENLKRRKAQQRVRSVQDLSAIDPTRQDPQTNPQNDAERIPTPVQTSGR
jgi:hypothetical protein